MLRRWCSRLLATIRRERHDREFRAEVESHIQFMVDERVAGGMLEGEARQQAVLRLGGLARLEESHREWRGAGWLEATLGDFRQAQRSMRRDTGFLLSGLATIALGIGAGAAVFSVVSHSFLRPLPYREPERVVSIGMTLPWLADQEFLFGSSYAQLGEELPRPFSEVASIEGVFDCELLLAGIRRRLPCAKVESSFLRVVGVPVAIGRDFAEADDQPGAAPVILLTHHLWIRAFGGDPRVIGSAATMDDAVVRIIGVLPRNFEMPGGEPVELVMAQRLDMQKQRTATPGRPLRVLARLNEGFSASSAASAVITVLQTGSMPARARDAVRVRVRPLRDLRFRDRKLTVGLLSGAAACLFLTTCASLCFLLLARTAARRNERSLRIALGADKAALFRQSIAEALFICVPGGLLGIGLAHILLSVAVRQLSAQLPDIEQTSIDGYTLLFAVFCISFVGAVLACLPLFSDRTSAALNSHRAAGQSVNGSRIRQTLVVSQIALCVAVIGSAATLLTSLWRVRVDGARFENERITTASFILGRGAYSSTEAQTAFFRQLEDRLAGSGLFTAVGISDSLPPSGNTRSQPLTAVDPRHGGADAVGPSGGLVLWRFVTPGYFDALRIPIIRGRSFTASDLSGGRVAVVNESLARVLFPDGNFSGRTIRASDAAGFEVIGIVEDIRNDAGARDALPEYYVLRQASAGAVYRNQQPPYGWRRASIVVRSDLSERAVRPIIEAEFRRLAPDMEVTLETMSERFDAVLRRPRFQAAMLMSFGATGLMLAAVGIYGLVLFLVAERRQEFAVRIALGAARGQIRKLVLASAFRWALYGALIGVVLAYAAARLLQSVSHEIVRMDPLACTSAAAVLACACVVAALVPAWRAGLTDPAATLREQ